MVYLLKPLEGILWYFVLLYMFGEVFHELWEDRLEFFPVCGHLG